MGIVGKAHHCMVDGVAALELAAVLLDRTPEGEATPRSRPARGAAAHAPVGAPRRAAADRAREGAALVALPVRLALRPGVALRMGGAIARAAVPRAPMSPLTGVSTPDRMLVTATRPVDDLRIVRRRWGTTINDAVLAVCAARCAPSCCAAATSPERSRRWCPWTCAAATTSRATASPSST